MRRAMGFGLLLGLLAACIDSGFPPDSGETGFAAEGCCDFSCSDGVTGGCTVQSDDFECNDSAEITCSGAGATVTSVSFDASCGGACAR
jgi:hypothetical protein